MFISIVRAPFCLFFWCKCFVYSLFCAFYGGSHLLCKVGFSSLLYTTYYNYMPSLLIYSYLTLAHTCVGAVCLMGGEGVRPRKLLHGGTVYSLPRALSIGC